MSNLQELKPVGKITPFTRFCCTIGNLPASYMTALSYEEQLLWLCNYLENTVIPAVNTNAEAVAELQELFIQLKNYVDNYFDNLDVQEEINNKLDEMAEQGTLQEIISYYLNSNALFIYNTVDDMKSATNLIEQSNAKTLGFYNINDGGGAIYKIRTLEENEEENNITTFALENGYIAELIIENQMNIKQFGAKCDLLNDDTTIINYAINSSCKEIIIDSSCLVSVDSAYESAVEMKSNKTLIFENNSCLKLDTNDFEGYEIINCENIQNFNIYNPLIIGDKESHTGIAGEWGHGLYINGCKNFKITNPKILDTWGDGLALALTNNSYFKNENGKITNINVINASRNGVHFEQGKNINIDRIYCENVDRRLPKAGIDFEQDTTDKDFENIYIGEIEIKDCPNGLNLQFDSHSSQATTNHNVSIQIDNVYLNNSSFKLYNFRSNYYKGFVKINNMIFENYNDYLYFQIKNNNNIDYIIDNINIISQAKVNDNILGDYSISIDSDSTPLKKLYLNNVVIDENNAKPRYASRFLLANDFTVQNDISMKIKTNKPLNLPPNVKGLNLQGSIIKLDLQDLYDIYNAGNLWGLNLFAGTYYSNKKASRNLPCNFGAKFPIKNIPITIVNKNSNYSVGMENPLGNNIIPSSESFTNKIVSSELGAEITFVYDEEIESYCLKNKIGSWSSS